MAVVFRYGKGFKDPNAFALAEPVFAQGRVRAVASGALAVANGDSIASKHYLGKLPSTAIIMPHSAIYNAAIAGLSIYNVGLELEDGTVVAAAALGVFDMSAAAALATPKPLIAALAVGQMGRRLYEIAGLTVDPATTYNIVGAFGAAATAAGSIEAFIYYAQK